MSIIKLVNKQEILSLPRVPLTANDVDPAHAYRFKSSGMSFDKDLKIENRYCYHPFNTVTIDSQGECYVCVCQAWLPISVGNILDFNSLTEIAHSPRAREIQASILDGTYKYCDHNTCHLIKSNNLETHITHRPDTINWIVFAIDESCNLTCPSCRTGMIFHNKGEDFDKRMRISDHIVKLIQNHHHFLRFTLSGDGDPFASHVYRNILENLQLGANDPVEIEIVTNGILVKSHWDRMPGVHNHVMRFKISFDAGTPETYAVTRRGGDWEKLIESCEYIIKWKQKYYSQMEIVANFVVQNNNYQDILKYVELTKQLGFDEISFQKVVDWGRWTDPKTGINTFTEHAVWMPEHPNYQDLVKIINDPALADPKIKLTNLSELRDKKNAPLNLSKLIREKNIIANLNISEVQNVVEKIKEKLKLAEEDFGVFDTSLEITNLLEPVEAGFAHADSELNKLVATIDRNIARVTQNYHRRGYKIGGFYATNRTDMAGELSRVLEISDDTKELVIGIVSKYVNWEYPVLEIGPGTGDWTKHLVGGEPLYLVDINAEFFDSVKERFTPEFQRKICCYWIDDPKVDADLSRLPVNQIGFVFSWNTFNYLTLDLIDTYLGEIMRVLRPGGVAMFSYNNAERYQCAINVDIGFMSYVPKKLLLELIKKHEFEILSVQDHDEQISWVEIKKPGQLTTIKRHTVLGVVITE